MIIIKNYLRTISEINLKYIVSFLLKEYKEKKSHKTISGRRPTSANHIVAYTQNIHIRKIKQMYLLLIIYCVLQSKEK